jgi:hypothetical protein
LPDVVEWSRSPWAPGTWSRVDQAPAFLSAFSAGDEVLTLSGEFVTTFGVFGTGPTAASEFILALVDALCERSVGLTVDVDLVTRSGMRTSELEALISELESAGTASQLGDGHWLVSLGCGGRVRKWIGLLVGSNLDYPGLRLAERDASIVLLAGPPAALSDAWAAVEAAALSSVTELKPLGWDLEDD